MPAEWKNYRLEDVCDFINGFAFKSSDYVPKSSDTVEVLRMGYIARGGGFKEDNSPVFVPRSYNRDLTRFRLQGGDIAIAMTDMKDRVAILGNTAWIRDNNRFVLNQRVGCIRVKRQDLVDARYLYFYSNWQPHVHELRSKANSGVQVNLSTSTIKESEILLPPLSEQKAVAALLGALDDKIELNRRMNFTLDATARALFRSWFVDFDPVRAKLDGRQPTGLDSATATATLFPEHFEHTKDGLLPLGWRRAAIEEVCDINARTLGKNDELETLEYVEISEVSRGNIANIAIYPRGEEPSRARRHLRHGDTVLSTVRPDRRSYFLALNPPENRVASTGFAVLTPTKVPWSFIHAAVTQPEVSDHLGQMADGGAYPAVRPEIIGAMHVAMPDEPKILEAFHRICAPLFEQAEANRMQSRSLATARDTLLPKLLSGELQPHKSS
jgi:type I restriction enzyme, S subunit